MIANPSTVTTLTKLQESLFILCKCSQTVERMYNAWDEHREKGPLFFFQHYSHNLAYYVIMEANSFLDEYRDYFTENKVEPEYKARVKAVREVVTPLMKFVHRWKDLFLYRSNIVAHGWRDKKGDHRLVVPNKKGYNIPRTAFEYQFLKDIILQVFAVIKLEFATELDQAIWLGYFGEGEPREVKDYTHINDELQQALDQMNMIAESHGKDYDIKITGYTFHTGEKSTG